MRDDTVEQFYDVLQNIEFAILSVYQGEADLLDFDVIDALDALVRKYAAEEGNRTPPQLRLSERASDVFHATQQVCEWRLGRTASNEVPADQQNSVADILVCLKRIRKSANLWTEQAGRQGYLNYISQFFPQIQRATPSLRRDRS